MARKQPVVKAAQPASHSTMAKKAADLATSALESVDLSNGTKRVKQGGAKLDRSKKFYDVHSGGNVKFEQDGKLFNLEGKQVDLDGNLVAHEVVKVFEQVGDPVDLESAETSLVEAKTAEPAVESEKTEGMTEDDLAALGGK